VHEASVAHQLVEEACIQQVQDRVLDAANVMIHGVQLIGPFVEHRPVGVGHANRA